MDFIQRATAMGQQGGPLQDYPLEQWQPEICGALPLKIDQDGQWWSTESTPTPYTRPALVKLLSSLLWCEPASYVPGDPAPTYTLKSPVEAVTLQVVDTPFVITDYVWRQSSAQESSLPQNSKVKTLICFTNLGHELAIGPEHPIRIRTAEPFLPYALVRRNLWARFHRNCYYRLVNELLKDQSGPEGILSIQSQGQTYTIAGGNNAA